MYQTKTYEIKSCDDIELGIKRDSLLNFKVSFDDEKPMKALFVFINGCGADMNDSYTEHISEFIVKTYEVAVISVNYHCIGNRPALGAKIYFDEIDCAILSQTCEVLGIKVPEYPKTNMGIETLSLWVAYLNNEIGRLRNTWHFNYDKNLTFTASFQPTKNEYQNFGVMQALDILNALCFVKKNTPFKLAKDYKTLLFGTSHGGYLALLCAKFAPWLIDAVVENSGYVATCYHYLCGKEIDYEKYADTLTPCKNITLAVSTKTHWTRDKGSPNHFSPAHAKIRSVFDEEHLKASISHHKPLYISYHSAKDDIASPQDKQKFYAILQKLGFDATLHLIKDEREIDGKFIKNLSHGMKMSLKTLIQKELPPLLARKFTHDKNEKREIVYPSENLEYHFKENAGGGGLNSL